ncbi:MAG: alanine/ornithine racemase family PLP-dependent enzyme [Bacillota bacterium]
MKDRYPLLEINLDKINQNLAFITDLCKERGISVSGVVKGVNAIPEIVDIFMNGDCSHIAHSRMDQLRSIKKKGCKLPLMLLRLPMLSEIDELVDIVDISLNSERKTLERIEEECIRQEKKHKVILMFDLGDLREGIIDEKEFEDLTVFTENHLTQVELMGIGTNLGCYGSVKPTPENLGRLCRIAQKIEERIGRKLEIVSGGATTSIPLILEGTMPEGINHLRIGEGILLGRDLVDLWGYDMPYIHKDTIVLKAQVIEVREKPTYPIGELFVDAFGKKPEYIDSGIRKRAILAVGKQDFVFYDSLIPKLQGVKIVGASSDHLIVDVEECGQEINLGDVMEFEMFYGPMLYLTGSPSVEKKFIR